MLSLKTGLPIAIINGAKDKQIYYKEASRDEEAELDTTQEQKSKIFKQYLDRLNKLKKADIEEMLRAYNSSTSLTDKTKQKILEKGIDYVDASLKRYLDFGKSTSLFPLITEPSYRMLITGGSGSGKTHFASEFLKVNTPRKGAGIFMFSPFEEDPSIKNKNIIPIKLESYEEEYDRPFDIEDLPKGSIAIFDDIMTYNKNYRQLYIDVMETLYERGRHLDISTICIQHNPLMGAKGKIQLRESMYYACFPRYNLRDSKVLLKSYTGMTNEQINEVMNVDSRWVMIKKSVPNYYVAEHSIGLLHN
jgi:hypothetical protein